ncbi:hypothetical protein FRC04_010513 [Tulasnella sp. 424]|nr:hypothetical protein FRC04_010513 [Tulasnella sp. 424]
MDGDVTDKGNGVVIGGLQCVLPVVLDLDVEEKSRSTYFHFICVYDRYYPDPIADLPTYTAVSQRSKPMKNHTGAIIAGVVGGVVFLAAIIVAGIFLYKPELRKRFISKKPGDTRKDLLGDSPSMAGASGSAIGIAGEEQRIEAGQPRMVERSHS